MWNGAAISLAVGMVVSLSAHAGQEFEEKTQMNKEEECVWLSHATGWPHNEKLWYHPEREDKKGSRLGPILYKIVLRARRGERLDLTEIPDWFYEPSKEKPFTAPNYRPFMGHGFFFIAPEVKEVFDQFDMGNNLIKPVELFKSDKKTVAHDGYCVLNIATKKDSFLPERSPEASRTYDEEIDIWDPPPVDGSGRSINMGPAALEGADIWWEERISHNVFFLSDPLVQALNNAGVLKLDQLIIEGTVTDDNWLLQRCPIIQT
ncbi:MAG: hypothetical protein GY743_13810 [Planctomycetaceae bacterium]|nr:hypothetical protein [Planctomycetaceae bacterium]